MPSVGRINRLQIRQDIDPERKLPFVDVSNVLSDDRATSPFCPPRR